MSLVVVRDGRSAEFFDAAARGELLIRRCPSCGRCAAPSARTCRTDGGTLEWAPAAGTGTLVSWAANPPGADAGGAVFGLVELAEGPWLETLLVGTSPDTRRAGTPYVVAFTPAPDGGEVVPTFTPA